MRNAKQFRDMAWHVLKSRYWWAVLAGLIFLVLGGGMLSGIGFRFDVDDLGNIGEHLREMPRALVGLTAVTGVTLGLIGTALALGFLFVGAAVELGYCRYHIRQYEIAKAPGIDLLFSRFSIFWRAVGLRLLMMLKVFLWSLLFIVPGIVAGYRYALAPYILAENPDMPAKEAIERSKELMQGHKARLFRLHLSFIGWYLLSLLCLGVGLVFLEPYVRTAHTGFYLERCGRLPLPEAAPQYAPVQPEPQSPVPPEPELPVQPEPQSEEDAELI